jgi:hypothetical protein
VALVLFALVDERLRWRLVDSRYVLAERRSVSDREVRDFVARLGVGRP